MTKVREQLRALRRDYREAKYPGGNLAADVFAQLDDARVGTAGREAGGAQPRPWPVLKFAAAASLITGVAAAVVLWVSLRPTTPQPIQISSIPTTSAIVEVATTQTDAADASEAVAVIPLNDLSAVPSFPDELPVTPSAESVESAGSMLEIGSMPTMPEMPSFDPAAYETSTSETNKESA